MSQSNWLARDGNSIERILFPTPNRSSIIEGTKNVSLTLIAEYMGDRTEVWVVEKRDEKEIARHNARMLETIVWKEGT